MRILFGAVVAATMGLSAGVASAVTVSQSDVLPAPITDPDLLLDPTSVSGFVRIDFSGSSLAGTTQRARSPYEDTPFEGVALYHSVSRQSEARYLFDGAQRQFSLVFGSPDSYNHLNFFLNGMNVFGLTGADLLPANQLGRGALTLLITDIIFDEVRMASSKDSFEFSNVASLEAVTSAPVPAPLAMLLASLAGLGVLRRRRSTWAA